MTTANVCQGSHPSSGSVTFVIPSRPDPVQATTAMNALRRDTQVRIVMAGAPANRSS